MSNDDVIEIVTEDAEAKDSNTEETSTKEATSWTCPNCLLDTSPFDKLVCQYCEAPKSLYEKRNKEKLEKEAKEKAEALEAEKKEKEKEAEISAVAGRGTGSDDPIEIDLDDSPVVISASSNEVVAVDSSGDENNDGVIDLISDDENEKKQKKSKRKAEDDQIITGKPAKKVKLEFEPKKFGEADDPDGDVIEVRNPIPVDEDHDVEMVAQPAVTPHNFDADKGKEKQSLDALRLDCKSRAMDEEEEVIFVSSNATMSRDMPHARHNCPVHMFEQGSHEKKDSILYYDSDRCKCFSIKVVEKNAKFCKNCFCYICDIPASQCCQWHIPITSNTKNPYVNSHCNASDDYFDGNGRWKKAREMMTNNFGRMLLKLKKNDSISPAFSTTASPLVPSDIYESLNAAKLASSGINDAYSSYEYGTRSSRGSYSWWGYDSADDDCEVTYTHNFTPVTERVASSLNLVHKYLNTDSKGTRSHGDTIKGIMILVEITKAFLKLDWNLGERYDGEHTFDSRAKKKYEESLKLISSKWVRILLGTEIDIYEGIRGAIDEAISSFHSGLDHLHILARNGWGFKGGVLDRLRSNKMKAGDEIELKKLKYLISEPDAAKADRCNFLQSNSGNNSNLEMYATIVGDFEYCARALYHRYQNVEKKSVKFLVEALQYLLKVEGLSTFSVSETVLFLGKIAREIFVAWKDSTVQVSCENDVANAMALLVMNVFYIGSIEGDPTYSNLVDREIDTYLYDEKFEELFRILRYTYAYFSSSKNVTNALQSSGNVNDNKNYSNYLALKQEAMKWVKGIIRCSNIKKYFQMENRNISDVMLSVSSNKEKWLELVIAGIALTLAGECDRRVTNRSSGDPYLPKSAEVARFMKNGFNIEGSRVVTKDMYSTIKTNIADEISAMHLIQYLEYSFHVSPRCVDIVSSTFLATLWDGVRQDGSQKLLTDLFPLSMIERIAQKKSEWPKSKVLNLITTLAFQSSVHFPWVDMLFTYGMETSHSSSLLLKNALKTLKNRLFSKFESGDDSIRDKIAKLLTTFFEKNESGRNSLVLLDFIAKAKIKDPSCVQKMILLEKEFKTTAFKILKKERSSLDRGTSSMSSQAKILTLMFILGETIPLMTFLSPSERLKSDESYCFSLLRVVTVPIDLFAEVSNITYICHQETLLGHVVKAVDAIRLFQQNLKFKQNMKFPKNFLQLQKIKVASKVIGLFSASSKCAIPIESLLLPHLNLLYNYISEYLSEKHVDKKPILNIAIKCVHVFSELSNNLKLKAKSPIADILDLVQKQILNNAKFDTKDPYSGHNNKELYVNCLSTILYADIKFHRDGKYSKFMASLQVALEHFSTHTGKIEGSMLIIRGTIIISSAILRDPNYNFENGVYLYDMPAPKTLFHVEDELKHAELFVSGGPLELSFKFYCYYCMAKYWNVKCSLYSSSAYIVKILRNLQDDFNLVVRNKVMNQQVNCFAASLEYGDVQKEAKCLKELLHKVQCIKTNENPEVEEASQIYIEQAGCSDKDICKHYDCTLSDIICNLMGVWRREGLSSTYSLWRAKTLVSLLPLNFYGPFHENKTSTLDALSAEVFTFITDMIDKKLTVRTEDIKEFLASANFNFRECDNKCYKEEHGSNYGSLLQDRVINCVELVIKLLKLDENINETRRSLQEISLHQCDFRLFLENVMKIESVEEILKNNHNFVKLRIIVEPGSTNSIALWRKINSWGKDLELAEILHTTKHYEHVINVMHFIGEAWTNKVLEVVWLAFYQSSSIKCLKYLDTKLDCSSWDRKVLVQMLIAICGNIKTNHCFGGSTELQRVWNSVQKRLFHGVDPVSQDYFLISFCINPSMELWNQIQVTNDLEKQLFDPLLKSCTTRHFGNLGYQHLLVFLTILVRSKRMECVSSLKAKHQNFEFYPSEMEDQKLLGALLKSNEAFQLFYEKAVISRCMRESHEPWSEKKATDYISFIKENTPTSWLVTSSRYFLTKNVKHYLELEKEMNKIESKEIALKCNWSELKKSIVDSLCPRGEISEQNIGSFVDSWITIHDMNSGKENTDLKNIILRSLSSSCSGFNGQDEVLLKFDSLLQKLPFIKSEDLERVTQRLLQHKGMQAFCSFGYLANIKVQSYKRLILKCSFTAMENYLDSNTVTAGLKRIAKEALTIFKKNYEEVGESESFVERLKLMKRRLRRKKPFLKYLNENGW